MKVIAPFGLGLVNADWELETGDITGAGSVSLGKDLGFKSRSIL